MILDEIIKNRTSVRKYTSEVPSKEMLTQVIEAARQAPSAVNKQPWRFVVITNKEKLAEIKKAYQREWIESAPAMIAVIGDHNQSWHRGSDGKDHCDIDIAIATEHITLKATDLGLSTCWVCNFDTTIASEVLKLNDGEEVDVLIPIGYADPSTPIKEHTRKDMGEIATFWE